MRQHKVLIAVVVAGGMGAIIWLQNARSERLRRDNEVLRGTIAELRELRKGGAISTVGTFTAEQRAELLKLRAEATQLRAQTNQIADLTEANQKLQASLNEARAPREGTNSSKKRPEDALPQDIHPRDSWAFRGYATPEATEETLFWAQVNGDRAAIRRAFSPEMQAELEKIFEQRNLPEEWSKTKMTGFRIVDRQELSDNEIVLTLYTDRPYDDGKIHFNSINPIVLQRISGEWKITDKHAPKE